jgi:hypothetical protein
MKYILIFAVLILMSCNSNEKKPLQKKSEVLIEASTEQSVTGSFEDGETFRIKVAYEYKTKEKGVNPYTEQVEKALDKMYQIGYNTHSKDYREFKHEIKPICDKLDKDSDMQVTLILITRNYKQ